MANSKKLTVRAMYAHVVRPKPMKVYGKVLPEYFTCTFYVIDNDRSKTKITEKNYKQFDTWVLEVLLRTTTSETVEIVKMSAEGARPYTGHHFDMLAGKTKELPPEKFSTLQARHFSQISDNRVWILAYAVTTVLQQTSYKKGKDGSHIWQFGSFASNQKDIFTESELQEIAGQVINSKYTKLDGTFYQLFAERYKEAVLNGDLSPIKTLQERFYPEKTSKHVQSYATEARKRGLLPKAEKGKNSPVRKTRKAGKK